MTRAALMLVFLPCLGFWAEKYVAGKSYFDPHHLIEYIPGDMPLVITAAHGGDQVVPGITIRGSSNPGCPRTANIVTVTDDRTAELALKIQSKYFETHGVRPYVIISRISPQNIDLNRPKNQSACGNTEMEKVWSSWHGYVHKAITTAARSFGTALYLDLHGHGHLKQRLEIGYALNSEDLYALAGTGHLPNKRIIVDAKNEEDESNEYEDMRAHRHSLQNLLSIRGVKGDFREFIFGEGSFGSLSSKLGLPAVPSATDRLPEKEDRFFAGGYNTRRYTGHNYPTVFGFQIECNKAARKIEALDASATVIMKASAMFLEKTARVSFKSGKK